jgi:hypothetical protein
MPEEWLRVGDVVAEYGVSRNTPRNWFNADLVRMRGGRFSRRDIERQLNRNSAGRRPGKRARLLSKREKELAEPFIRQHGLRKLRRLLWSLPIAAKEFDWTAKKRQDYANVLREGANEIFPIPIASEPPPGGLLERRESERRRLTDAFYSNVTRKTGVIVFEQADPGTEPGWEIVPFFIPGISKEDEQYVLLEARDPNEFYERAKERGYDVPVEKGDPTVRRPHPLDEHYKPDFAAEIDNQDEPERDAVDILVKYKAITDPIEKECFRQHNFEAIQAARMERAKPANWEALQNIATRRSGRRWKWIKIDDGYGFKAVPAELRG